MYRFLPRFFALYLLLTNRDKNQTPAEHSSFLAFGGRNITVGVVLFVFMLLSMNNMNAQDYKAERLEMVRFQIEERGIESPLVLKAMRTVPRHLFVPENIRMLSYSDRPLDIGFSQTISQPYIVAYMSEALDVKPGDKVLEIGTGSGYQAAVLAEMGMDVWTMEIIPDLAQKAQENLKKAGYSQIHVKCGNGYKGWPEEAPFDAIILTAAPEEIPETLLNQMKIGGTMIVPVGAEHSVQSLKKVVKKEKRIIQSTLLPVRFVPMVKSYL